MGSGEVQTHSISLATRGRLILCWPATVLLPRNYCINNKERSLACQSQKWQWLVHIGHPARLGCSLPVGTAVLTTAGTEIGVFTDRCRLGGISKKYTVSSASLQIRDNLMVESITEVSVAGGWLLSSSSSAPVLQLSSSVIFRLLAFSAIVNVGLFCGTSSSELEELLENMEETNSLFPKEAPGHIWVSLLFQENS